MILRALCFLTILFSLAGCEKEGYDHTKYLKDMEVVYTGIVSNLSANPGNRRVQLTWNPSSDPSISKYVIFYNNRRDSLTVSAGGQSTSQVVKAIVPGLGEFIQDFTLFTYDAAGNKSIGQTITAVRVYGEIYTSTLRNRQVQGGGSPDAGSVVLNVAKAVDTVNITTRLTYKNTSNVTTEVLVHPDSTNVKLTDWKEGENILIRSAFVPRKNAIDTFWVVTPDTLKGKDLFYGAKVAGSHACTGTIERQGNPPDIVSENKDVSYLGGNIFKTILPFFNNTTLTLYLKVNDDNSVTIQANSGSEASVAIVANGPCSFDEATKTFTVNFIYNNSAGLFRKGTITYKKN